jgi:hypothetical protein
VDSAALSRSITLRLPPGKYTAAWRDTRGGRNMKPEQITSTGEPLRLNSPVYSEDVALLIKTR